MENWPKEQLIPPEENVEVNDPRPIFIFFDSTGENILFKDKASDREAAYNLYLAQCEKNKTTPEVIDDIRISIV
jgi:hypothetical protein